MGTSRPRSVGTDEDASAAGAVQRSADEPATTGTLHALARLAQANASVVGELAWAGVLRSVAAAARELADARYAVLDVVGPDGALVEIVASGTDEDTARRWRSLPRDGSLAVPVVESRSLRTGRSSDGGCTGLPEGCPPAEGLLAVPVLVSGGVVAVLHLVDKVDGLSFSAADERAVEAFAVSAGVAMENARLHDDGRRRHQWAEATSRVTAALLDPRLEGDPVGLVVDAMLRLADADFSSVAVTTADPAWIRLTHVRGDASSVLQGTDYASEGSAAAEVLRTGRPVLVETPEDQLALRRRLRDTVDLGVLMVLPLQGSRRLHGVLSAGRRPGRPVFTREEIALGESFAAQAAVALDYARARADQQRLVVVEARERIARDLHDQVVSRLFVSGLTLDDVAGSVDAPAAARLDRVVHDLDTTIAQIRSLIFRLHSVGPVRTLRSVVLDVSREATEVLGFAPTVVFDGPVDAAVEASAGSGLVDDVAAVVREALSNVARHARARRADVRVQADTHRLLLLVRDDGVGLGAKARHSGVGNLERRAAGYGGTSELVGAPGGGTEVRWSVPLAAVRS